MNTAFALVLTVFLNTGEPVDLAIGIHDSMKECMAAAAEQKIPGNCYPVDKVFTRIITKSRQDLKQRRN
ncbi:hypothetical protein BvCmsOUP048_00837 [Escherichia coli]|nr:hypothetical protein BvCmsL154A_00926 [Escherichia coli]GDT29347.1 hypothetical protein BvCmsOUP048_00837 [Escherichia coli]